MNSGVLLFVCLLYNILVVILLCIQHSLISVSLCKLFMQSNCLTSSLFLCQGIYKPPCVHLNSKLAVSVSLSGS